MKYLAFKKHVIRNDRESVLLFYDHVLIFPSLGRRIIFIRRFLRWSRLVGRIIIKLIFIFKLNYFLPARSFNENFIMRSSRKGQYKTASVVILKKNAENTPIIIKEYANHNVFKNEERFISTYGKGKTQMRIPKFRKINDRTAEIEFIKGKSLLMKIRAGEIKKNQLLPIYKMVARGIDKLYSKFSSTHCLIHGDFGPANVLVSDEMLYIIDFADSHIYEKNFDKFNFLKQLLYYYFERDRYDIISNFFSKEDIDRYSTHYLKLKKKKYG